LLEGLPSVGKLVAPWINKVEDAAATKVVARIG
jgi:hypothetical protein